MKKRIISFFTALSMTLMLFTGMPISVSAAADESDFTFNSDNGAITGYTGAGGDVVIPDTIGGVKVTSINALAFQSKASLTSVTIPDGVNYIGNQAFYVCSNLTSVIMPDSVTEIGIGVFERCSSLKSVTISNNLTSINQYAFSGCSGLESITIPNSVTSVRNYAFQNCSSLTSVKIPSSVTSYIGNYAFQNCSSLEIIILPSAVYNRNSNIPSTTTRIEYAVNDDKLNVTQIVLGSGKNSVIITDDMGIDFVAVGQRSKVVQDGHTHKGGTATCIAKAKCDICNVEHGDLGTHTIIAHDAVPADCTTNGNGAYWTCSVCNKMFSDENGTTEITEIPTIPAGHKYSEDWESGDNEHWHECTVCHNQKDIASHTWNDGIVTKEPDEENEGEKTYTCTVCSATKTESLDKLTHTHTLTSHAAVPATCTTDGNKAYWTCSGCNKMFSDENGTTEIDSIPVIPAAGHKYEWKSDVNEHWHECTVCGDKKDNASHTWNDGIVTTEPDEDTEGEKTYTCTICSATKTESIGKTEHKHTLTAHDAVPADCTTNGNEAYWTCSGCDKMFSDENGTREITAIPTIPATGHKFSTEWASDSTYHWYAATCGHDVVSDKAVHSWDSGIVTTEPTEEAAGVKTFTCTVCSATRTESVSQIPHTHTYSTEWTSDSTSHWHAATCGHDVTSEAAAHTEDGGTVTVPATTENDGLKTYACSVCGYVMRTVTIPKLGEDHTHNFSPDWKHDSTSHWHECDCGEKNEIAPHVEDGGVVTTEPTETSTGIMTYSCETCGYVMRTDVIPALTPEHNHTFGTDWKYDSVSHWHECECGEKSDIANHISSDWIVVTPATTDLEGVQIRKCTVCGIEIDRETIEKLPNISTGDVAEDVRDTAGTNAGLVQDNTLIENVLTTDDKTEVTEGHSFEIVLEVTDIRDSVPAADVTAASSALRYNEQIGIYVDLSLFKIKDNSERTPIYNTSGRIGITLTVPDSIYASDRTYSIIRVHDGIAENLGGIYDKASRELTFYTDKFSTYAIAYAASNSGTDRPSVPDTPTNPSVPSVPTYPNTPVVPVTPTVTETTVKKEEEVISDEPYVEDVSSAAGIYESGETDSNIHYVMILIFAASAGIAAIAAKKHFCKKNMK